MDYKITKNNASLFKKINDSKIKRNNHSIFETVQSKLHIFVIDINRIMTMSWERIALGNKL